MKRRAFLQGIGGAALAVPYLGSLARTARAASDAPQRVVIFYTANGCLLPNMQTTPADGAIDASTFITLRGLGADVAPKMLFPRGIGMFPRGNVTYNGTTYFDPHDQGMGSKYTCAPIDGTGSHWAQGMSFDHIAAAAVNEPGTGPLTVMPGTFFANVKGVLSYKVAGDGTAFKPETSPTKIYSALTGAFVDTTMSEPVAAADYKVLRGNSILDLARDDLKSFEALNMSAADQEKVRVWKELLRSTETRLIPTSCNAEAAAALLIDDTTIKTATSNKIDAAMTLGGDMFVNLFALTMLCDQNRVLTLQWPNFITFKWDGMNHDADHHGISHRTGSAAVSGADPEKYEPLIEEIDNWYGGKFARMVNLFNSIKEGDVKLLDNTATIWLPELGDGMAHNNTDLPITICGNMGGFLKSGVSIQTDTASSSGNGGFGGGAGNPFGSGGTPINQLYVTLLNGLGANGGMTETFGVCDTNTPEDGITKVGGLTAIEA